MLDFDGWGHPSHFMNVLNSIFILAVAFIAVFVESSFGFFRNICGAQIDLLPALIVYTSLTGGIFSIALLAICGGLWFDSLSANALGVSILPLFLIGFFIYRSRDLLLRDLSYAQFVLGFAASALAPLLTVFLLLNIDTVPLLGWKSLWQWFVMAIGGGLLTPVCFAMFDRINRALNYQAAPETHFRQDREIKRGRA